MDKVFLASYKSIHEGLPGIINRGIRFMDRSIYSHSELCIGNPFEGVVECYSSSGVDHGVRVKQMQLNPDKWDVIWLPYITAEEVRGKFSQTAGEPYDYFGTGRFMLPFMLRQHPKRWFCSEWTTWVMGYNEPWRFSPAGCHILALTGGGVQI